MVFIRIHCKIKSSYIYREPITTGASVIALKYKEGVILAADTLGIIIFKKLGSYGSLAEFKDFRRIFQLGEKILVGASGDLSDFQYIKELLESIL